MADAVVFLGWGQPVRGREANALKVFGEGQAYMTRLQQSGKIESFDTVVLQPHGGDLAGFSLLRGDAAALEAVVAEPEFQTLVVRASLIAEKVGVVRGATGAGLAEGLMRFQQASAELGA